MTATIDTSSFLALGTTATVCVIRTPGVGNADAEALRSKALDVVHREVDAIDAACSRFRPSELTRLEAMAGMWVPISPLLHDALALSLRAARLTDGAVDPTVGSALIAAGYDRDLAAGLDSNDPPRSPHPAPGWQQVRLDTERARVVVPMGVKLDLGATAKGLAADRAAAAVARELGTGALVSLGGDVAVAGQPPIDGWMIGIAEANDAIASPGETISISDGGVATSSTTARTWRRGAEQMHHLIDPRTGSPAGSIWRTVSVAASSCADANIASTAAIVWGEAAIDRLRQLGVPARLVGVNGSVVRLGGWPDRVAA